ncbi:hypothetical protein CEUSTIGMA_g7310.t1 [Chlamydomonas eustigma]|uniref:Uncharacterized protein n=1 Tax=Chlamydomonas eustigma TaxID=1157962 RepID=A0A250XAT5_9CHLO|nr:hypothetical protein CEUSTIGMA_g7310.t1 [Chlamydomonas eustigma]|eukprot:GAX79870.1 hypothetical protein CEUSTIGMA_g7310.t1 [Chlamydomonas eustigma]
MIADAVKREGLSPDMLEKTPEAKRALLRQEGQRKFEEWKSSRSRHGSRSSTSTPVPAKKMHGLEDGGAASTLLLNNGELGSHSENNVPFLRTEPKVMETPQTPTQSIKDRHTKDSGLDQEGPIVNMLLAQIESLMQDKATLLQDNSRLRRENEQLHELVGYLSADCVDSDEQRCDHPSNT